ncbi:MAG: hypothetical protein M1421_03595 [Candidatus Eremiobacteraeota bacterium]|nr:hypothetical protein [Candidatus Eremiobacteraeota bacterium]MCL5054859.1 hypothetical protein [Bacillota bacterium]
MIGQGFNGQSTFEQLQSQSVPIYPAPGRDGTGDSDGGNQPQNKLGDPLWSWLLCPPAAFVYNLFEYAGIGSGVENRTSGNSLPPPTISSLGYDLPSQQ